MSLFKSSISAVSATASAKIFTAIGAVVVLWLINEIAGKTGLGLAMLAYALHYIFATAIAAFFQAITTYHVARDPGHHSKKTGVCLTYGIIVGFVVAYGAMIYADNIAALLGVENFAMWFSAMALMIPAFIANAILSANERARGNVPRTMMFFEILPMVFQIGALAALLYWAIPSGGLGDSAALGWSETYIGWSFVLAYALPFIMLYLRAPVTPRLKARLLSGWDIKHGLSASVEQITHKSMHHAVLVFLGILTMPWVVAEFALALRFANFLMLPKLAVSQLQVPRMGRFLKDKNLAILVREFDLMRMASLAMTILLSAVFLIIAPPLFGLFGGYDDVYTLFSLLAVAAVIRAGFGTISDYMGIAGYDSSVRALQIITFSFVIFGLAVMAPIYGGVGAGLVIVASLVFSLFVLAITALVKDGLNSFSFAAILIMVGASGMILSTGFGALPNDQAALGLLLALLIGMVIDRDLLKSLYPAPPPST